MKLNHNRHTKNDLKGLSNFGANIAIMWSIARETFKLRQMYLTLVEILRRHIAKKYWIKSFYVSS